MSSVSSGRTRPQTEAANGVVMSSNRAMTGPWIVPGSMLQTGLFGNGVVEGLERGLALVRRPLAVAAVQDHERAVLEVVDPALRAASRRSGRRAAAGSAPARTRCSGEPDAGGQ